MSEPEKAPETEPVVEAAVVETPECCERPGCEEKTCHDVMSCEEPDCTRDVDCCKKPATRAEPTELPVPGPVVDVIDELMPIYQAAVKRADELNDKMSALVQLWADSDPDLVGKSLQYDPARKVVKIR